MEGPGEVYICGECVELSQNIIEQEKRRRDHRTRSNSSPPLPSVEDFQRRLCAFLPELKGAAQSLAASTRRHFERLSISSQEDATEARHNAILLAGPTQSSKLLVARVLAHICNVPFVGGDVTTLTADSPACQDADALLYKLLIASDFDLEAAQRGIIYVDGVDRRDFYQSLERALDGTGDYGLPQGSQIHGFRVDVSNILFVCGGKFEGLDKVIAARGRHLEQPLLAEDLVAWGMPSDLVQCFRLLVTLAPLGDETLVRVLSTVPLEVVETIAG